MLRYNKKGFLRGVPARDLTDDEAKQYGEARLVKSGLYERVKERKAKKEIETPEIKPQAEE